MAVAPELVANEASEKFVHISLHNSDTLGRSGRHRLRETNLDRRETRRDGLMAA